MKVKRGILAVLLSAVCIISGGYIPEAAENDAGRLVEDGLVGYWNFEGEDPMENSAGNSSLTGELSGSAVTVRESEVEELGKVLYFGPRGAENSKMQIESALNSGENEFTISLWLNNSSQQISSGKTVVLQQSDSGRSLLFRRNG